VGQNASDIEIEVIRAERAVDEARARLGSELEVASEAGRRALARITRQARPVLAGVAIVAAVAVVAGAVRLVRSAMGRRAPQSFGADHGEGAGAGRIARSALTSVASTIVTVVVRRALYSFLETQIASLERGTRTNAIPTRVGAPRRSIPTPTNREPSPGSLA